MTDTTAPTMTADQVARLVTTVDGMRSTYKHQLASLDQQAVVLLDSIKRSADSIARAIAEGMEPMNSIPGESARLAEVLSERRQVAEMARSLEYLADRSGI